MTKEFTGALRPSLFPNVPPLLNYIPGSDGNPIYPPYYLREQLWRVPIAVLKLMSIDPPKKTNEDKSESEDIFVEDVKDAGDFKYYYDGCNMNQMPSMVQLSRKDLFWDNFKSLRTQLGPYFGNFVPYTVILPYGLDELSQLMQSDPNSWWIVKPPNLNGGTGIKIIDNIADIPPYLTKKKKRPEKKYSLRTIQTTCIVRKFNTISSTPTDVKNINCVQRYIRNPYLINGHKFDLRLYVLITCLDPLLVYLYNDGLVRFATEPYSNLSQNIHNKFIHLTNYQINKDSGHFIYNDDPSERLGHKWRLKSLWKHLKSTGLQSYEFVRVWARIEDMVIKSILTGLEQIRDTSRESSCSRYNSYKLLGFDVILDSGLMPHLLEINTRPSLYPCKLDQAVNQPMVNEMFKIVGYHLPNEILLDEEIRTKFGISEDKAVSAGFAKWMYTNILNKDDTEKQNTFKDIEERDDWKDGILGHLAPADVRVLIKSEEELRCCEQFSRIFPTSKTYSYFSMAPRVSYFDKLLDAYEHLCEESSAEQTLCLEPSFLEECSFSRRTAGINLLFGYCQSGVHLVNPLLANFMNQQQKERVVLRERNRTKCKSKMPEKRVTLDCSDLRWKGKDTTEIKKRLDEMGGFATLSKVKQNTVLKDKTNQQNKDDERKTKSKSIIFESGMKCAEDLSKFDHMTINMFFESIKSKTIKLKPFNAEDINILFLGDNTLSSLDIDNVFQKVDFCPNRRYSGQLFSYLTTMEAVESDRLMNVVKSRMAEDVQLVVALYMGLWQGRERGGAEGAAERILKLSRQINNLGVSTVVLSLMPLLITERRGDLYSKSWTSQVNQQLSELCSQNSQPYLPLHHLLYNNTAYGLGVAPSRSMVISRGCMSNKMAENVAKEIVSYVVLAHQPVVDGYIEYY